MIVGEILKETMFSVMNNRPIIGINRFNPGKIATLHFGK